MGLGGLAGHAADAVAADAHRRGVGRIDRAAHDMSSGAGQLANYFVGQIVGSMNEVKPATRVVLDMVDEMIDAVQRVDSMMMG